MGSQVSAVTHKKFIGRQKELKILNQLLMKQTASLVVIRGRRRVGKSRLIQEFSQDHHPLIFSGMPPDPEKKITAQMERDDFAAQLQQFFPGPAIKTDDWNNLFWFLADRTKKGRFVIVLDEISWLGSQDPTFLSKLKTAWDLHFSRNPKIIFILSGSVSQWIKKNILSHTGFLGRISIEIFLEELSLSECNEFWKDDGKLIAPYEKFKLLSIIGGIPRYLEEVYLNQTAEQNIRRLCFQREGFLFNEFEKVFSDLFSRRSETYRKILKRLTQGKATLKNVVEALKVEKSGVISEYLEDLIQAGFIQRDFTWHLESGENSKLSHYRLSDNYSRFYLKYIEPNQDKIKRGAFVDLPAWQVALGFQFENLVLKNRSKIQSLLGIKPHEVVCDNPFFQRKTKEHRGCQIDYLIQTQFNTLYACEIKFSGSEVKSSVIEEMQTKLKNLVLPKGFSVRPVLIHVNSVSEAIQESRYFAQCIEFGELLQGDG